MKSIILAGLAALPVHAAELPTQPGVVSAEFIFDAAPFPSCHASTIVETSEGLVSAWFGGTKEGDPDVGIWLSRWKAGKWSEPVEVANGVAADGKRYASFNPVLFQPSRGPLLLFYKTGAHPSGWAGFVRQSTDHGATWSEPAAIPEGCVGPVKNKPIELSDGTLLCPSSLESSEKPSKWQVQFERTSDFGKSWSKTPFLNEGLEISAIQPSVLRVSPQHLVAVGRTRQGHVFRTESADDGTSWSAITLTDLPNPNSGTDAVTLRDGRHLLVYNHTAKGRSPLNVALSSDTHVWQAGMVLEAEPGEYSYPAVIEGSDGRVHITYTWKRKKIRHVVLDPSKLVLRPIQGGVWPQ